MPDFLGDASRRATPEADRILVDLDENRFDCDVLVVDYFASEDNTCLISYTQ